MSEAFADETSAASNPELLQPAGLLNTAKVIGTLIGEQTLTLETADAEQVEYYFEDFVYPILKAVHVHNNARVKEKHSDIELSAYTYAQYADIFDFAMGEEAKEIAARGKKPRGTLAVENSISAGLSALRSHPKFKDPNAAKNDFLTRNPSAKFATDLHIVKEPPTEPKATVEAVVENASVTKSDTQIATKVVAKKPTRAPRTRRATADREIGGRDSVGLYLDEIARTPLLDAAKEVELAKTIEAGLYAKQLLSQGRIARAKGGVPLHATREELEWLADEGAKATTEFINANLRLVVSIARKYGRASMPMLDLIQEGNTGLIRAVEKFDFAKGYKFSTYATWWVRQAITRGIAQQARVVRLPVNVVEELNQMGGARRTLERQFGREPEPQEIAAELGMDLDRVHDLMQWSKEHVSLDTPVDEDGDVSIGDLMRQEAAPAPDEMVLDIEARDRLNSLVGQLDERAANIIRARYGLIDGRQHKLADVGAKHGISAERVRQLEREALQKLRRLGDPDLAR